MYLITVTSKCRVIKEVEVTITEQELIYNMYYVSTWTSNNNITIKQTKLDA